MNYNYNNFLFCRLHFLLFSTFRPAYYTFHCRVKTENKLLYGGSVADFTLRPNLKTCSM